MIHTFDLTINNATNNINEIPAKYLFIGYSGDYHELVNTCFSRLSDYEKDRALKFKFYKDKLTYIATHYELRELLSQVAQIEPSLLKIHFELNKKPYLKEFPIDFNISHSTNIFSVLIADKPGQTVGVDIETIQSFNSLEDISKRFMHKNEREYILKDSDENSKAIRFLEIWTRKEAFLKLLGVGIQDNLDEFDLTCGIKQVEINLPDNENIKSNKISCYTYTNDEFLLSVCKIDKIEN